MATAAALGVLAAAPGRAAEVSYFYGYRAEFSDNVERVAFNPKHDMINALQAGVNYQDRTRTIDLRLAPTVDYVYYKNHSFDNQARLNLDSSLLWTVSPERLTWTAEDTAREVRINPAQPDTPANTALANLVNTGPDLYLHAGSVNTLRVGARYANVYVSDTNLDNQRGQTYARWLYQYSPVTTWSLNVENEKVRFDDNVANVDFRRRDAFLGVRTSISPVTNASLNLGRTVIARTQADEVTGNLVRLNWNSQLNTTTSVGLVGESSLSDTGTDLAATAAAVNSPTPGAQTVSQNLVAQDVFEAKRGELTVVHQGSRVNTSVTGFGRRLEFRIDPANDRRETGGEVRFAYLYSATTSFDLSYSNTRAKYSNRVLEDTDSSLGLRWLYLISRNVSVSAQIAQDERNSTDPAREFVDNRLIFSVQYNSGSYPRR